MTERNAPGRGAPIGVFDSGLGGLTAVRELRRILPKGRSDFDAPTCADLAVAASHVNSYPRAALGGRCPVDAARALLPEGFVDLPGVVKVPLEEVVLRPSLLPHAVDR